MVTDAGVGRYWSSLIHRSGCQPCGGATPREQKSALLQSEMQDFPSPHCPFPKSLYLSHLSLTSLTELPPSPVSNAIPFLGRVMWWSPSIALARRHPPSPSCVCLWLAGLIEGEGKLRGCWGQGEGLGKQLRGSAAGLGQWWPGL